MLRLRLLLFPLSVLYFFAVWLRNKLFDLNWLKSQSVATPTLVIGNLTTGGTGKSPHTMWIVSSLNEKIALLSRGYGRKTRGFLLASPESSFDEIGDEPLMMARRFPELQIAVCEDRVTGCNKLNQLFPEIQLIVLDDAYQHRRLRADRYVLLCDYARPFYSDYLLPAGDLRDLRSQARRASAIWITKCPENIADREMERMTRELRRFSSAPVFFSSYRYAQPRQIRGMNTSWNSKAPTWVFCGIAEPRPFENYARNSFHVVKFSAFSDHHSFSEAEKQEMTTWLNADPSRQLLTTEKDAMRLLKDEKISHARVFMLPISVSWIGSSPVDLIQTWFRIDS